MLLKTMDLANLEVNRNFQNLLKIFLKREESVVSNRIWGLLNRKDKQKNFYNDHLDIKK
jgi:hypothetical protein